jgi:hypothetical protein
VDVEVGERTAEDLLNDPLKVLRCRLEEIVEDLEDGGAYHVPREESDKGAEVFVGGRILKENVDREDFEV